MVLESVWCPTLHGHVSRVVSLEGEVASIVCPEYQEDGTCRLKNASRQGGPLTQLLERVEENVLERSTICDIRARAAVA